MAETLEEGLTMLAAAGYADHARPCASRTLPRLEQTLQTERCRLRTENAQKPDIVAI